MDIRDGPILGACCVGKTHTLHSTYSSPCLDNLFSPWAGIGTANKRSSFPLLFLVHTLAPDFNFIQVLAIVLLPRSELKVAPYLAFPHDTFNLCPWVFGALFSFPHGAL